MDYNITNCTSIGQILSRTTGADIIETTIFDVTGDKTSPANRDQEVSSSFEIKYLH